MLMAPFDAQKKVRQMFQLALGIVLGTGPVAFVLAYLAQLTLSIIGQYQTTGGVTVPPPSFDSGSALASAVALAYLAMVLSATYVYLKAAYALIDELERYARAFQDRVLSRLRVTPGTGPGGRIVQAVEQLLLPAAAEDGRPEEPQNHQTSRDKRRAR